LPPLHYGHVGKGGRLIVGKGGGLTVGKVNGSVSKG
jgi:hypothetical protein